MTNNKIKCCQCKNKLAILIEKKKYYCADCALHNIRVKEGARAFTKSMVWRIKYKN